MSGRTALVLTQATADELAAQPGPTTVLVRSVTGDDELTAIGHLATPHQATAITVGDEESDITIDWPARRVSGHLPHPDGTARPVDLVRVVGDGVTVLLRDPASAAAGVFDRQVRAFGDEGQRILSRLHIGVVGAGGTGSAVCGQLLGLGVGRLTVIDPDVVTETNITRIWGSTLADVDAPKVQIVKRSTASIGLGTDVTAIQDTVANEATARALRHCDVVFGCTDDNLGRLVLSRLAYIYLIPVIDMGVRIEPNTGHGAFVDARISYMAPGSPCLDCRNWIDHDRLAAEDLTDDERETLAQEGYVAELGDPDPSVITYTTAVAAHAVSGLLNRLFDLAAVPPDQIIQFHAHTIRTPHFEATPGHFCIDPHHLGAGDLDPFLDRPWPS